MKKLNRLNISASNYALINTQKDFDNFRRNYAGVKANMLDIYPAIVGYEVYEFNDNEYIRITHVSTKSEFITFLQECIQELQDE